MSVDALDMSEAAAGPTAPDEVGPWDRLRAYLAAPQPPAPSAPEAPPEPADAPGARIPEPEAPRQGDDPLMAPKAIRRMLDSDLVQRVAGLRTPGGLFPLIVFILFMLFAIVPVNANGDTRIFLLWRALTGGAFLPMSAAHQRRLVEDTRIAADNAQAAQIAQAAGQAASTASQLVNGASQIVQTGQAGWDTFWATSGGTIQVLAGGVPAILTGGGL